MSTAATCSKKGKNKVLITGCDGQLGYELQQSVLNYPEIEAVFCNHHDLDITDHRKVESKLNSGTFSHIVNCAAYTAVDNAEKDVHKCRAINVEGVKNIVEAVRNTPTRLIQVSTDYVFDGVKDKPYVENDSPNPLSVYGASKADAEQYILDRLPESVVLRTGWVYSGHGHNFVKTVLRNALAGNALKIVNDQQGTPTYAADMADTICRLIVSENADGGIYHYSGEGECTWYDFSRTIIRFAGITADITPCTTAEYPTPAKRPRYAVLDKSKIKDCLELEIPDWTDSLKRMLTNFDLKTLQNR